MGVNKNGFTLIELMVAIAIIAVLAAVGMVVYASVQKTARMSKRTEDFQAIKTALEAYKAANGQYPVKVWTHQCSYSAPVDPNQLIPNLAPNYMTAVPTDPLFNRNPALPSDNTYCYWYNSDGPNYKFGLMDNNGGASEITDTMYNSQPNFIDPASTLSSSDCATKWANRKWAIYSGSSFKCN